MKSQLFIADARKFDAHPAAHTNVRRPVKFFGRAFDQHFLDSDCGRYRDRNVPIVMMVNGAHGKHLLDKERWFAMRKFFRGAGQRETDPPDALYMFLALVRLWLFRCWFHLQTPSTINLTQRRKDYNLRRREKRFLILITQPIGQHAIVLRDKKQLDDIVANEAIVRRAHAD